MASLGTSSVEVKSGYALTHHGELRLLSLIARLARLDSDAARPDVSRGARRATGIRGTRRRLHRSAHSPDASGRCSSSNSRDSATFCEPGFFTPTQATRLLRAAAGLGLGIKVHAEEFVFSGGARVGSSQSSIGRAFARRACGLSPRISARRRHRGATSCDAIRLAFYATRSRSRDGGCGRSGGVGSDLCPNSWVESMPIVISHAVYRGHLDSRRSADGSDGERRARFRAGGGGGPDRPRSTGGFFHFRYSPRDVSRISRWSNSDTRFTSGKPDFSEVNAPAHLNRGAAVFAGEVATHGGARRKRADQAREGIPVRPGQRRVPLEDADQAEQVGKEVASRNREGHPTRRLHGTSSTRRGSSPALG